jgi:IS5 family transposase
VIVNRKTKAILATAFAKGKTHDFQLFKDSRSPIAEQIRGLGDAGYQGVVRLHANSQTPFKKSKHHPLTKEQKAHNRALAHERILVEHVIRSLKIFRILSERYRNRRKRFALRFNLIAALYNSELEML